MLRTLLSSPAFRPAAPLLARALSSGPLKQTLLHDRHIELGGKMVPFAGYSMPVQYPDGIKDSHLFVRSDAGLFDVSHMGQLRFRGKDAPAFLAGLVVADVPGLKPGAATLSLLTSADGGILDDTIVTNLGDGVLAMVVNAGCKDKDLAHISAHLADAKAAGKDVTMEIIEDHELLALQGPKAMHVLASYVAADLTRMPFMSAAPMSIMGGTALVSRCGYTGEDGFEISVPANMTRAFFDSLIEREDCRAVGLGARDSLRLEAGLCLYGNDIDETTSPIEAGLTWTIPKSRRTSGGFLGAEKILADIANGVSRRRVGFVNIRGAPARGHEKVIDEATGNVVGEVTSGGFSPCLGKGIGMAYIEKPKDKAGTKLAVEVRGKLNPIEVTKMPLVPSNYYKVPE
mmetsp:Transcript_1831/g.4962  ORF Transcript_1831/g.4962 Transcript_1831/m.4962 type:complete len:401 (-) Transcript_1831:154-1356(-)